MAISVRWVFLADGIRRNPVTSLGGRMSSILEPGAWSDWITWRLWENCVIYTQSDCVGDVDGQCRLNMQFLVYARIPRHPNTRAETRCSYFHNLSAAIVRRL